MKLAVSTYSLWRWRQENKKSVEQALDWLAGEGLKAVELSVLGEQPADPIQRAKELRKYCDKVGLKIVSYCVGGEYLLPPDEQRRAIEVTKREVDIAAELGVPSMRHDVTRGPKDDAQMTLSDVLKQIAPAVREITEYGAKRGVKTTLENHGFYMQTAERVEKLIQAVGHPNYGLTIDMGNFLCLNQDPVDAVKRLAKYVFMAHTKDFHVKPKSAMPPGGWFATPTEIALRGAIVGHGVIDVPAQLKILKDAGYNGYLSLEFEGMEEPTQAVRLGLEYVKKQLEAIGALG